METLLGRSLIMSLSISSLGFWVSIFGGEVRLAGGLRSSVDDVEDLGSDFDDEFDL
jgi:hypothetical protein